MATPKILIVEDEAVTTEKCSLFFKLHLIL